MSNSFNCAKQAQSLQVQFRLLFITNCCPSLDFDRGSRDVKGVNLKTTSLVDFSQKYDFLWCIWGETSNVIIVSSSCVFKVDECEFPTKLINCPRSSKNILSGALLQDSKGLSVELTSFKQYNMSSLELLGDHVLHNNIKTEREF